MRLFSGLVAIVLTVLLAACGGGGGPEGVLGADGKRLPLSTTAPSSVVIGTAVAQQYNIIGGRPPYQVSSSDVQVAIASVVNSNRLSIGGIASGSATLTLSDVDGQKTSISVTISVPGAQALFSTAPPSVTMAAGFPQSYSVGGGFGPYTATSSNTSVAISSINGNVLTVIGLTGGDASIVVRDSVGTTVIVAVTVQAPSIPALFTTAQASVTIAAGAPASYSVGGGSGGYTVTSSNAGVASAFLSGNTLSVIGISAGSATVVVRDSAGSTVSLTVTVPAITPVALSTTAPGTIIIASAAAPATYSVSGGTLPYQAVSSNGAVVTASVSGTTLSVNGLAIGSATVEVSDAAGTKLTILVTVSPTSGAALSAMPSGATGNVGDTLTFTLLGGSPGYSLVISNATIATLSTASVAANAGTFTATLLNVGATDIRVRDAQGQTTSLPLTVESVATQVRVSPSTFIVGENEIGDISLNIFGGTPPYRAFSSDLLKATASTAGNTLRIAVGTSGTRCINPVTDATPPVYIVSGTYDVTLTVIDNLGASATSIMTIKDNGAGLGVGCP